MKKFIAIMFVVFLFASSSSYALDFIKFGIQHDRDFWGTPDAYFDPFPSTVQFLAARGKNQLTSVELTDQNVQDAFNGDFGAFEAIVVSEKIDDSLSNESYAMINQFVSVGGCLILTGDHANGEDEFLNNAFGYNVGVIEVADSPPLPTFPKQAGAAGTKFETGPGTLVAADKNSAFSNTPGTTIYSGTEGVALFTDQFGRGTVVAIGYDYCCTESPDEGDFFNTEAQILDWYDVVNRAFDQCQPPVSNVPTLSEWGLIAMASILGIVGFMVIRRRKVTT